MAKLKSETNKLFFAAEIYPPEMAVWGFTSKTKMREWINLDPMYRYSLSGYSTTDKQIVENLTTIIRKYNLINPIR